jgi:hypothetical protein
MKKYYLFSNGRRVINYDIEETGGVSKADILKIIAIHDEVTSKAVNRLQILNGLINHPCVLRLYEKTIKPSAGYLIYKEVPPFTFQEYKKVRRRIVK